MSTPPVCFTPLYQNKPITASSLPDSNWSMKSTLGRLIYDQCEVAFEWGVPPSFLGICQPVDDPPMMAAFWRTKKLIKAYDEIQMEKKRAAEYAKSQAELEHNRGRS